MSSVTEKRLTTLEVESQTQATEIDTLRSAIDNLTTKIIDLNNTIAHMKGFWAGLSFAFGIIGAGLVIIAEMIFRKVWP